MNYTDAQRFTLLLLVLITGSILLLDLLLWHALGVNATFSRAVQALMGRWPVVGAILFIWIGILIGHLLPAGH